MPFDSDVALLGTGVAPLVAANQLIAQGKSVLLLNPDRDFFLEDSELPLDPFLPLDRAIGTNLNLGRVSRSLPERALGELRPDFPGAVEFWSEAGGGHGFHDSSAPHVRSRSRLWIASTDRRKTRAEEVIEDFYVAAADGGFNPQILQGLQAAKRFPGIAASGGEIRGVMLPKLADFDVTRYRNGLLEYVRERLGPGRVICGTSQLELMPEGVRFHAGGSLRTARLRDGMLVFWTPRLTQWLVSQCRHLEAEPVEPEGVRLWEQWSVHSRESIDPGVVGIFENMAVWAEAEGIPSAKERKVAVLRPGPLVPWGEFNSRRSQQSWASAESFHLLSSLFHEFLKWDRFSVRAMKPRAILEWNPNSSSNGFDDHSWYLSEEGPCVKVVAGCDGPLTDVVRNARSACEGLGSESPRSLL